MLYVAYGSNMNRRQMARRCPKARPLGPVRLAGWRLVMKRVADIEPAAHAVTPAALWEITRACERALDAYEGFPHLYIKERIAVALASGKRVKPMAYVMNGPRQRDYGPASDGYLAAIADGYRDFGFDDLAPLREGAGRSDHHCQAAPAHQLAGGRPLAAVGARGGFGVRMRRTAMRYRALDDGRVYEAATAAELVDRLRALSFMEHGDTADFMVKIAANCAAWDGTRVRAGSAEHFVEDLVICGFLERAQGCSRAERQPTAASWSNPSVPLWRRRLAPSEDHAVQHHLLEACKK